MPFPRKISICVAGGWTIRAKIGEIVSAGPELICLFLGRLESLEGFECSSKSPAPG